MKFSKRVQRQKIKFRIRKKVKGTASRPRLSVFKSNKDIYCQLIDDVNGVTLVAASSRDKGINEGNKTTQSSQVGEVIAERAKSSNIESIVFDRSGYVYHGRVKALAEGARKGGLKF